MVVLREGENPADAGQGHFRIPPSRGRGGIGGGGWGGGQGRSLGDGLRLRGKMTWASVRKKLSTVSRTFHKLDGFFNF
ncbi:MAG: hypothetical protein ACLR6J_03880 [Parabacteroides merdae]